MAWDMPSKRERVALAKEALRISPLCADAYVLLAEEAAASVDAAAELFQMGVDAGAQALGEAAFAENAGHFWGILETRPYMRARAGLAQALWAGGRHEEAVGHYRELLRLNPNDNQGNRYLLAAALLDLDRDADLADLLASYGPESTADWSYTSALAAYRREGDTADARALLKDALSANAHVPRYLLGYKKPPRRTASYITLGGEDEAQEYTRVYAAAWERTEGARDWLAAQAPPMSRTRRRKDH